MHYSSSYKDIIWTNHVLERLKERRIPQDWAWRAFTYPDKTIPGKSGSVEYQKRYEQRSITVVAKKNDRREWIILSCWVEPPLPGSSDIQKKKEYWKERNQPFIIRLIRSLFSLFVPK